MVIAPIVLQVPHLARRKEATAVERTARMATNEGFSLAFVIGGALI